MKTLLSESVVKKWLEWTGDCYFGFYTNRRGTIRAVASGLYSYGVCIARHAVSESKTTNGVLLATKKYSTTTSKHIHWARKYTTNRPIFLLPELK